MTTLTSFLDRAMRLSAEAKARANAESAELDARPFALPARGPWCKDYGTRSNDLALKDAYRATLAQLGLQLQDDGRMRVEQPSVDREACTIGTYGWAHRGNVCWCRRCHPEAR